jgi:16S rRNA (cytidine1402-2'-O)-methyltransferase
LGTLYVVATPIGNMEDMTLRALRVLKEVDLIAAEDTRRTRKLLSHYGISTPLTSYFEHNERAKAPFLVKKLKQGKCVALVTEAGTPGISDPGYRLVRLAVEESIPVVAVPGPSALTAVLSVAGLPTDEFTFKGFLPAGAGRRRRFLLSLKGADRTFVLYEAPGRLKKTLGEIKNLLGNVEVVIAREITKLHEEVLRGRVEDLMEQIKDREIKGEITIVLRAPKVEAGEEKMAEEIKDLIEGGLPLKDAVALVSSELGIPKTTVYRQALRVKGKL